MFTKHAKSLAIALVLALGIAANSAHAASTALTKPLLSMTKHINSSGVEFCTATVSGNLTLSANDQAILNSTPNLAYKLRVTVEAVDGLFEGGFEGVASDIPDQLIEGPVGTQLSYSRTDGFISLSKCNEDPSNRDEFVARVRLLDADGRQLASALSDELQQQFE